MLRLFKREKCLNSLRKGDSKLRQNVRTLDTLFLAYGKRKLMVQFSDI